MFHVRNVEQLFKLEKQKEKEITIFAKIIQLHVIIFLGTSPKPGEKWNPEEAEEVKKETEKKTRTTKKSSTKRKTTAKKTKSKK